MRGSGWYLRTAKTFRGVSRHTGRQLSLEAHSPTELSVRTEAVRALMSTKDAPRGQGEITSVVQPERGHSGTLSCQAI